MLVLVTMVSSPSHPAFQGVPWRQDRGRRRTGPEVLAHHLVKHFTNPNRNLSYQ